MQDRLVELLAVDLALRYCPCPRILKRSRKDKAWPCETSEDMLLPVHRGGPQAAIIRQWPDRGESEMAVARRNPRVTQASAGPKDLLPGMPGAAA